MPVADCGVFEVGEHSEVGALESPLKCELTRPSLLERMSFRKALNKVPAAACWDYAEIPLRDG